MKTASPLLFSVLADVKEAVDQIRPLTPIVEKKLREAYGFNSIAGIDEAGRGPLAGPVVAAAVVLNLESYPPGIHDSKRLSPRQREDLFEKVREQAVGVGIGMVESEEIDLINIRRATLLAMKKAVEALPFQPDFCIIDGLDEIPISIPQSTLVKGDSRCLSVAAASIVAKVTRDRLMRAYHQTYPGYGFDRNMGYGTRQHREALRKLGPTPLHRRSFRGVERERR
jgi:ribonuclease HII